MPICKKKKNHVNNIDASLATRCVGTESRYLFGNEAAVHLVVVLSDLHDGCQGGDGQVDAKRDPLFRDQPERGTLCVWVVLWAHRQKVLKVGEEREIPEIFP